MRDLDVAGGDLRVAGIAELEATPDGYLLHRMPAWARRQHNDPTLDVIQNMPSGCRLELRTSARSIEIDCHLTHVQLGSFEARPGVFDLVVDGDLVACVETRAGTTIVVDPVTRGIDFVPGDATTVRFDLPAGEHAVEVWLPVAAAMRLIAVRVDGDVGTPPEPSGRRWIHYGSSISHCMEATRPTGAWPAVAARLAQADLRSIGLGGQCHLDPFAARIIGGERADLVSAKLGINIVNGDTMRERTFVPALHGFLDTVRDSHPDVPLLVISPITCPAAEDHPGPTAAVDDEYTVVERPADLMLGALTVRRIRELERQVVESRQADDPNLHFLEGTALFGPDDVADLPDGLHPNAAGYQRMGERFFDLVFSGAGPFAA